MIGWLRRYAAHDDPTVAAGNFVALVLAWNQPFYPVFLWFIIGSKAWAEAPDILSGLLFFAIPAIARRHSLLGRVLLPVFGIANVAVVTWILSERACVWLLLFPCGMLAASLFTRRERWIMAALTALPMAAWLVIRGRMGPPMVALSDTQLASVATTNTISAFALLVFFGWVFTRDASTRPTDPA